jgi:uncharacterized protein YbjT (DUF2867 family)
LFWSNFRLNVLLDFKLQTVAAEDLAVFVAMIIEKSEDFRGRVIDLVGDERTMVDYAQILGLEFQETDFNSLPG